MLTLACLALAALAAADAPASAPEPQPHFEIPFEKYTLPSNGLEVILSVDHALPVVAVNLWYHAGPINEPKGRSGFAHLFEHLMFQGSGHVGDDQHFKLLEARGGSGINATTDYDRTNYFETVPTGELALALWLESDRMGFLLDALSQEKLDNQRDVVMNERRQRIENAPYGPSSEAMAHALFAPAHPYHGMVIGSMEHLAAAHLEDVREFYTRFYAPANATLVIAGDFEPAAARQLVDTYFAGLPRREAPARRPLGTAPLAEERRVEVTEPVALARVAMAWRSPAAFAPGDADADVLAGILADGKTSRLYRRLVYSGQLASDVAAGQESQALTGSFMVAATARPGADVGALEAAVMAELAAMRDAPPTAAEVARARNQLLTRSVAQLQPVGGLGGGRADTLNRYNQYVGDPGYFAQDMARYAAVTPESVQALAKSVLDPDRRVVVVTVPQ